MDKPNWIELLEELKSWPRLQTIDFTLHVDLFQENVLNRILTVESEDYRYPLLDIVGNLIKKSCGFSQMARKLTVTLDYDLDNGRSFYIADPNLLLEEWSQKLECDIWIDGQRHWKKGNHPDTNKDPANSFMPPLFIKVSSSYHVPYWILNIEYYVSISEEILGYKVAEDILIRFNQASGRAADEIVGGIKRLLREHLWCERIVRRDIDDPSFLTEHLRRCKEFATAHTPSEPGFEVRRSNSANEFVVRVIPKGSTIEGTET